MDWVDGEFFLALYHLEKKPEYVALAERMNADLLGVAFPDSPF